MDLWTSKVERDDSMRNLVGRRSFRWVLSVDTECGIHLHQQVRFDDRDGVWWDNGCTLSVNLEDSLKFSQDHAWYDGGHCLWKVGFLRFYRGGFACKKCMPA